MAWKINQEAQAMEEKGVRVGVICIEETKDEYTMKVKRSIGKRSR